RGGVGQVGSATGENGNRPGWGGNRGAGEGIESPLRATGRLRNGGPHGGHGNRRSGAELRRRSGEGPPGAGGSPVRSDGGGQWALARAASAGSRSRIVARSLAQRADRPAGGGGFSLEGGGSRDGTSGPTHGRASRRGIRSRAARRADGTEGCHLSPA